MGSFPERYNDPLGNNLTCPLGSVGREVDCRAGEVAGSNPRARSNLGSFIKIIRRYCLCPANMALRPSHAGSGDHIKWWSCFQ